MNKFNLPNLGFGLGLRAQHMQHVLAARPKVDWFEVISENYMDSRGQPRADLRAVRKDYPLVMHGVSMSIGSSDALDMEYLQRLKNLAEEIEPEWISDHLCWTGINGKNSHDLLPVPLTEEALTHVVGRIGQVQEFLGRRILLENPSSYLTFKADHIPEYEFMAELAKRADCGLLLDVNNIYVASFNHRLDARKYIDAIPLENVVQIHLAGHTHKGNHIVDTHDGQVVDEVWDLYKYAISRAGFVPSTMVEWDAKIPEFEVLEAEIAKARNFTINLQQSTINYPSTILNTQSTNHNILSLQENLQQAILSGNVLGSQPETWIVEKENFAADEQLAVYTNGYRLRLFDSIISDYEVTADLAENLPELVREYIQNVASEFYNAADFSAQFAEWLQGQEVHKVPVAVKDMARLEVAIAQCYNLPEGAALTAADMQKIAPEDFVEMQLHPLEASALLEFESDVHGYMSAFYRGEERAVAEAEQWVIVYRHGSQTYRLSLEAEEFALLKMLDGGAKIGEAFAAFEGVVSAERIQGYFGRWLANNMLAKG